MFTTILCLANSRKNGRRCIAGVTDDNAWIRPVSDLDGGGLEARSIKLDNGREPAPLDIIEVPVVRSCAERHQSENWLVASGVAWRFVGALDPAAAKERLNALSEEGARILGGWGDKTSVERVASETGRWSLTIRRVGVGNFEWVIKSYEGSRRNSVSFFTGGKLWRLPLTDGAMEMRLTYLPVGSHRPLDYGLQIPSHLTISVGEPYGGYCYRLVAAVHFAG
jgi:hypothetical protein